MYEEYERGDKMKVAARRAGGALIGYPVLLFLIMVDIVSVLPPPGEHISESIFFSRWFLSSLFFFINFLVLFIRRCTMPYILVAYDDNGVYIYYKHKKEPLYILNSQLYSFVDEEDEAEQYVYAGYYIIHSIRLTNLTFGILKTGTLQIRTEDNNFTIPGVYHVEEACSLLNKNIRQWREKQIEELQEKADEEREKDDEQMRHHFIP